MTITTISDQYFNASAKFHAARDAYARERAALGELERQLLNYTEQTQSLPDQAEYIGEGEWRAFDNTITASKYGEGNFWRYICNPTGKRAYSFEDAAEAVAFLGGYKVADDWHEDMNEKQEAARQQSLEHEARLKANAKEQQGDATDLTVAT